MTTLTDAERRMLLAAKEAGMTHVSDRLDIPSATWRFAKQKSVEAYRLIDDLLEPPMPVKWKPLMDDLRRRYSEEWPYWDRLVALIKEQK